MFGRIMVPTDGSDESAKAIPIAAQLAQAHSAEVVLVRVVELITQYGLGAETPVDPNTYDTLLRAVEEQASTDLARLQETLASQSVKARALAPKGFPASSLLDVEQQEKPDIVVMATHGRTGLARFALGSVADRLVREGATPVLLVRRTTTMDAKLETAVVMLDGSGVAEQALPVAASLAGQPLRSITLFQSVSDPNDREPARTYLGAVADRLRKPDCAVRTVVDVGDPRHTVERVAREHDMVILSTHGYGGIDRLRHGSVAEAVVHNVESPVLLVRAEQ
jgi:nucleotide-binding universal stress UspA family protein